MITNFVHAINILVLSFASFYDIKSREVPDILNYGLIITAFFINAFYSLYYNNFTPIITMIIAFLVFSTLSILLFYTGQWGGGDTKLLIGLGTILGIYLPLPKYLFSNRQFFFSTLISQNNFIINFLINLLFVGAIYGLVFAVFLLYKHKRKFSREFRKSMHNTAKTMKFLSIILVIILFFNIVSYLYYRASFFIILLLSSLVFFIIVSILLNAFVKSIEKSAMYKYIMPSELTEGDWVVKDIVVNGKKIVGPSDFGVSEKQIKTLIKLYNNGKVKKVLIKEGIPFVPSFLIAYIFTILSSQNLLQIILNIIF